MQNGRDIDLSESKGIYNIEDTSWRISKQPYKMGLLDRMKHL